MSITEISIGEKIHRLRIKRGLTQEELANRCELSKGFISQLERDLTSPSIATLCDILQCLGTDLRAFFNESQDEQIVFTASDMFEKEDETSLVRWLVPNAQKNSMEPIIVELSPGGSTDIDDPHEGEEFGYVLMGAVHIHLGDRKLKAKRGESFYYRPACPHALENAGQTTARVIWISTPPSF